MTLQQKLLAKQSKKGFTLVELVVVIAILGILAAIAIPAVIGIINSANESQAKTDASSISAALKTYYSDVIAGNCNSTTHGTVASTTEVANLPAPNASGTAKNAALTKLTVQGALEYYGIKDLAGKIADFVCDPATGTVYAYVDGSKPTSATLTLATTTTLDACGYKGTTKTTTPATTGT